MDYLLSLITGAVGNEQLARLVFLCAIGLSAVLAFVTVGLLVLGLQDPVQRRLILIKRGHGNIADGGRPAGNFQLLLEQVGQRITSREDSKLSPTRTLLMHAGYRSASVVQVYWAIRLLLPLLSLGVAVLILPLLPTLSL